MCALFVEASNQPLLSFLRGQPPVFLLDLELDKRSALVGQGAPKIYLSPFPRAESRSTMPHPSLLKQIP